MSAPLTALRRRIAAHQPDARERDLILELRVAEHELDEARRAAPKQISGSSDLAARRLDIAYRRAIVRLDEAELDLDQYRERKDGGR